MAEDSDNSLDSQDSPKSSRYRTRIGPKKAARIAAGEVRKKEHLQVKAKVCHQKDGTVQKQTKKVTPQAQGMASRKLALETLIKIEKDGAYANLAINAGFEKQDFSEQDRAFVIALVQGVMRNQSLIDQQIQTVSKEPWQKCHHSCAIYLDRPFFNWTASVKRPSMRF